MTQNRSTQTDSSKIAEEVQAPGDADVPTNIGKILKFLTPNPNEVIRLLIGVSLLITEWVLPETGATIGVDLWEINSGQLAIWLYALGSLVISHLAFEKMVILLTHEEPMASNTTTQFWMETTRSITNWLIAASAVVMAVITSNQISSEIMPRVALVSFGVAVIMAFVYVMLSMASTKEVKDGMITINSRRMAVAAVVFNLMFTAFIGGVIAIVIANWVVSKVVPVAAHLG